MAPRDPHSVLGVDPGASQATIKAAWRRLAREHHPDLAPDDDARENATRRMAEINAAYEVLRTTDGKRHPGPTRARPHQGAAAPAPEHQAHHRPSGPPPEPPAPPVTARLDTTLVFHPRNATTTPAGGGLRHHPRTHREPLRARVAEREERRASDPNGPLERHRPRRAPRRELPSVSVARAFEMPFGKFSGWSVGAVAVVEPTYLEWVSRTITRDPDLLDAVRVVLADLGRVADGPADQESAT